MKIRDRIRELRRVPAGDLRPNPKNWRTHPEAQADALRGVLAEVGIADAVLARELPDGSLMLIDGHLRVETMPTETVPVLILDVDEAEADKILATLDPLAAMAEADAVKLDAILREIDTGSEALQKMLADVADASGLYKTDDAEGAAGGAEAAPAKLADRFGVPPFSVISARDGWWQDRKRSWLSLGMKSESGREAAVGGSKMVAGYENGERVTGLVAESDTSIFDPVLCELVYKWFSPPGGVVLDPFAGGSVRGVVASRLGRIYTGVELRAEQVEANQAQASLGGDIPPKWINGDSRDIAKLCKGLAADLVFSCPPYADLERYSDDPADLSTLAYADFAKAYREIIAAACGLLKNDRFACFVVGDVRDKHGRYYNFVGDTVEAFRAAGLHYYNEAILVTAVGSLPIRAGKQFAASRKLGKTHQNVLVFVKGDGKKAAEACGECDFGAVDEAEEFGEVLE